MWELVCIGDALIIKTILLKSFNKATKLMHTTQFYQDISQTGSKKSIVMMYTMLFKL